MCQESAMIVTGVVESSSWVIRPERRVTSTTSLPDGKVIVKPPNPAEYLVGTIFQVKVDRVIKKQGTVKVGSRIRVFVPGFMTTEQPALVEKQNYLLFLSKFAADRVTFAGTMTYKPRKQTDSVVRFKPELTYVVAAGPNGAIRISSD